MYNNANSPKEGRGERGAAGRVGSSSFQKGPGVQQCKQSQNGDRGGWGWGEEGAAISFRVE